jgi:hypothetical protein
MSSVKRERKRKKRIAALVAGDYPWDFVPNVRQTPLYFKGQAGGQRRRLRKHIIERDGVECHWCYKILEQADITLDHYFPWKYWLGTEDEYNSASNIVVSCEPCNRIKGDKSPIGFRRRPKPTGWRIMLVWFLRKRSRARRRIRYILTGKAYHSKLT